jgi:hypothetical protein
MFRLIRWTVLGVAGAALVGFLCFGTDCFSYATSSFKMLRGKVKNAIPLDFELERARTLLADLVPELQANVVVVAQEEVAIDELQREIDGQRKNIACARASLKTLKSGLTEPVSYTGSPNGRRDSVVDLARRFSNLQLAEQLLQGKERVLAARKSSLDTAVQALKDAQIRKVELEAEVERLEQEVRLMRAENRIAPVAVDQSSLAKAERLVSELRKRLDLAQKVLIVEPTLAPPAQPQESEEELFTRIDRHLGSDIAAAPKPEAAK